MWWPQRIRDLDRRIGALEKAAQGDTPPNGQPDRRTAETRKGPCTFYPDRDPRIKNQRQPLRTGRAMPLFILPSAPAPWTR